MEDLTILYEDTHVIVVLKPQNIPSQADVSGDTDMLTIIKENWEITAKKYGLSRSQIESMRPAFGACEETDHFSC